MTVPSHNSTATGLTDAGSAWSFSYGASLGVGRVAIFQVFQDGATNGAVALTSVTAAVADLAGTGSAMTKIPGPNADGSFPVGGSGEARKHLWIGRIATTGTVTLGGTNSTSEDLYVFLHLFDDVSTGTTLATVIENVLDNLTGSVGQSWGDVTARTRYAQSFPAPGPTISAITLRMLKNGSPTDTITVALQADSAGVPSGTDLATATIDGATLTGSYTDYPLTISASTTAGNTYWIVLRRSGAVDGSNNYSWGTSGALYADGQAATYNPPTWTGGGADRSFRVTAPGGATNGAATNGTIADAAVTTLGIDRLALNFIGINDDNAIAAMTGMTGGSWGEPVPEYADSAGTDASIGIQAAPNPAEIFWYGTFDVAREIGSAAATAKVAQSFLAPSNPMRGLLLALSKVGSPTDDLIIEIQTDSSNAPSGTIIASYTKAASSIPASSTVYSIPLTAPLTPTTKYWVVLRRSGSYDASNYISIASDNASRYASGSYALEVSGSWSVQASNDLSYFGVFTTRNTVDGGTATNADATDGWGTVGFALIGNTKLFDQRHYRFRNDNGSETAATWKAALDATTTYALGDPFRLRFDVRDIMGNEPPSDWFGLKFRVNGGSWTDPSTSVQIAIRASSYLTNEEATTQQLTSDAGWVAGSAMDINAYSANVNLGAWGVTEIEYSLVANSGAGSPLQVNDVVEFALYTTGTTPVLLTKIPSFTVVSSGTAHTATPSDSLSLTDARGISQGKSIAEAPSIADSFSRATATARTVPDTLALTDALVTARGLAIADSLALTDQVTPVKAKAVTIDDTVALSDQLSKVSDIARIVADTLALADAVMDEQALSLSDALSLDDQLTRAVDYVRQIVDPPFPSTAVLDTFTGSDEEPITTNWTAPIDLGGPTMSRWSNRIAGYGNAYYDLAQFGPDCEVYLDVATVTVQDGYPLEFNTNIDGEGTASVTLYGGRFVKTATGWQTGIFRMNAGSVTWLEMDIPQGFTVVDGDGIGMSVIGNVIRLYHRSGVAGNPWKLVQWYDDSAAGNKITAPGYIGLYNADNNAAYDNFGGGSIPSLVTDQFASAKDIPRSLSDTEALTDSFERTIELYRTVADTETLTDQATIEKTIPKSVDDSIALADQCTPDLQTGAQELTQQIDDTLSLADQLSRTVDFVRSITDTESLADQADTAKEIALSLSDPVVLADQVSTAKEIPVSVADSLTLADQFSEASTIARAVSDTLVLADAVFDSQALLIGDQLALTDTPARTTESYRTVSDTETLADQLAKSTDKALSDTETLADLFARATTSERAVDDALALADELTSAATFARTLADSLALADQDTESLALLLAQQIDDVLALADEFIRIVTFARSQDDSIALGDSFAHATEIVRTVDDSVTLTDSVTRTIELAFSDSVTLADALTMARELGVADTLSVADQVFDSQALNVGDQLSLTDQLDRVAAFERTLTDDIALTDSVDASLVVPLTVSIDDAVAISSAVHIVWDADRSQDETLYITDQQASDRGKSLEDSLALADQCTPSVSGALLLQIDDAILLSDQWTRGIVYDRTQADGLVLADQALDAQGLRLGDLLDLADQLARATTDARTITDQVALADQLARAATFLRSIADTLALEDLLSPQVTTAGTVQVDDVLTVADELERAIVYVRTIGDTAILSDVLTTAADRLAALADTIVLTDLFDRTATYARSVTDEITLTDLFTKELIGPIDFTRHHGFFRTSPSSPPAHGHPSANEGFETDPTGGAHGRPRAGLFRNSPTGR